LKKLNMNSPKTGPNRANSANNAEAAQSRNSRSAAPRAPAQGVRPGEIRIIGGLYKRSKLPVPLVDGLRPTPDRVRETLFNWLGQDLSGWRCLDAFAGTGALGLECASRGAAQVILVEQSPKLAEALAGHIARLGCGAVASVKRADGLSTLAQQRAAFELVMLDPPFDAAWAEKALEAAAQAVAAGGFVYWEAAKPLSIEA
jgi:16S rRNA (guanine966-N2)-methyltransferase